MLSEQIFYTVADAFEEDDSRLGSTQARIKIIPHKGDREYVEIRIQDGDWIIIGRQQLSELGALFLAIAGSSNDIDWESHSELLDGYSFGEFNLRKQGYEAAQQLRMSLGD